MRLCPLSLPRPLTAALLVLLSATLCSCGGNSDGSSANANYRGANYQGTWNARYNLPIDDCQIVLPDVPGFVDVIEILQTNSSVVVSARSGFFGSSEGSVSAEGNLSVVSVLEGDFFGNGSLCTQQNSLSFSPASDSSPDDGSATSLFEMSISCTDGFECLSRAVGTAERQPAL